MHSQLLSVSLSLSLFLSRSLHTPSDEGLPLNGSSYTLFQLRHIFTRVFFTTDSACNCTYRFNDLRLLNSQIGNHITSSKYQWAMFLEKKPISFVPWGQCVTSTVFLNYLITSSSTFCPCGRTLKNDLFFNSCLTLCWFGIHCLMETCFPSVVIFKYNNRQQQKKTWTTADDE